jgi:hypothetical protein
MKRREFITLLGGAGRGRSRRAGGRGAGAAHRRAHERGCGRYGSTGSHRCGPQGWLRTHPLMS